MRTAHVNDWQPRWEGRGLGGQTHTPDSSFPVTGPNRNKIE
jgi:hypothetical protein